MSSVRALHQHITEILLRIQQVYIPPLGKDAFNLKNFVVGLNFYEYNPKPRSSKSIPHYLRIGLPYIKEDYNQCYYEANIYEKVPIAKRNCCLHEI